MFATEFAASLVGTGGSGPMKPGTEYSTATGTSTDGGVQVYLRSADVEPSTAAMGCGEQLVAVKEVVAGRLAPATVHVIGCPTTGVVHDARETTGA